MFHEIQDKSASAHISSPPPPMNFVALMRTLTNRIDRMAGNQPKTISQKKTPAIPALCCNAVSTFLGQPVDVSQSPSLILRNSSHNDFPMN